MTRSSSLAAFVCVLCVTSSAAAFAQAPGGQRGSRAFNVDALTASIAGRVTTADTGAPIRRAEVRAVGESGITRLTTTDGDGWYEVRDLPAGTFRVHASKTGFVPLYHGQRRPFERPDTISLAEGQRGSANLALPRAGAITGRIVDEAGEPVMGARVQAMRVQMVNGRRGLQTVGAADTTDDTGAYRVYALPPGDYFVTVAPRIPEPPPGARAAAARSADSALVYYPGTASRQEAQRITVGAAGEARADVQFISVRASTVRGTILTSSGVPAAGAMVRLMAPDLQTEADALRMVQLRDDADAGGTFEITGVPPGLYTLRAEYVPRMQAIDLAAARAGIRPHIETAYMPLTVDGDVTGVNLFTAPAGTFEITFERDREATAELPRGAQLTIRSGDRLETMRMASPDGRIAMSFGGPARVAVSNIPDGWMLKAILLDGEDVTDQQIEVRGRTAALRVVLTDRVTEIAGTIAASSFAAAPSPAPPATVVIFSEDPEKWTYPSRFVRAERAGEGGAFRVTGLPPGDYRIVAVDYLDEGEETDPEFLQHMRDRAMRFSLNEAERRTIDLRVTQR